MHDGWIKLYRKLLESPIFDNPDLLKVWIWCLLKASHVDHTQVIGLQEIHLKSGQFVFGRKKAAIELNMSEAKVYRLIKKLELLGNLNIKSNNKFSVITIVNWDFYQNDQLQSEQQTEQQNEQQMNSKVNNKRTTNEQQMNTNKNGKNGKNGKNDINNILSSYEESMSTQSVDDHIPYQEIVELYNSTVTLLPKVKSLNDRRRRHIKVAWNKFKSIEPFREVFEKAEKSDFLSGWSGKWLGCNFDWLVNYNNMIKVLEGTYDNDRRFRAKMVDYEQAKQSERGW